MENKIKKIEEYAISDINRLKIFSEDIGEILESNIKNLAVGVCVFKVNEGRKLEALYLSEEYFKVIGYDKDDYKRQLKDITSTVVTEDEDMVFDKIEESVKNDNKFEMICRGHRKDGQIAWYNIQGMPIHCKEERTPVFLANISDISRIMSENEALKELKAIKEELIIEKQRYRVLEETTPALLFEYLPREDNMIFSYNFPDNHERKIIYKYLEFLDKTPLVHRSHTAQFKAALLKACKTQTKGKIEYLSEVSGNGFQWHRTIYFSVLDKDGNIVSVMGRIYNVNDEVLEREKQEKLNQIDALTGAYIKNIGYKKMETIMKENCNEETETYLVMIDIDNFKEINDTKGHSIGDNVLKRFSQKIVELIHDYGFVTRFGGDEFLIFVQGISEEKLHEKMKELHDYAKNIPGRDNVFADFSEGIVRWKNMTLSQVFEEADRRMYETKKRKKREN